MQFGYINDLISDPRGTLIFLLLALPGRMLAISLHEAAHGWMAEKCGDPTARMLGRITLNPLKHLDPVGVVMMLVLGIGWARPVPVNPRNFRNYRRDDLLVSIAGVTVNLISFLLGGFLMYVMLGLALSSVPFESQYWAAQGVFRSVYQDVPALISGNSWIGLADLARFGLSGSFVSEVLITPAFGAVPGYLYEMLSYFTMTSLVLAVFKLIPLPPLDGYHVLNDLFLRRPLFASYQAQRAGSMLLYIAMFTGALSEVLGTIYEFIYTHIGDLAAMVFSLMGLF